MGIGLAVSGSGYGALWAQHIAEELQKSAFTIDFISVCSLAAAPLLLWTQGVGTYEIEARLRKPNIWEGELAADKNRPPLAVNCVDTKTGITVIYTDLLHADGWNLKTKPLSGHLKEAVRATISPWNKKEPFATEDGMTLCDFSVQYGCPFFPLRMAGVKKILSVTFAGATGPAQIASESLCALTGKHADLHYVLHLTPDERMPEQIMQFMQSHREQLYEKLLF